MKNIKFDDINTKLKFDKFNLLNNQSIDKGKVRSREYGNLGGLLGGEMTKRLVEIGKEDIIKKYRG